MRGLPLWPSGLGGPGTCGVRTLGVEGLSWSMGLPESGDLSLGRGGDALPEGFGGLGGGGGTVERIQ